MQLDSIFLYIDPANAGAVLQYVIAGLVVLGIAVKVYCNNIKFKIQTNQESKKMILNSLNG